MKTTKLCLLFTLIMMGTSALAQSTEAQLKAELTNWEQKFKQIAYVTEFAKVGALPEITYAWEGPTRVMIIKTDHPAGGTPKRVYTIPLFQNAASVLTITMTPNNHLRVFLNSVKPIKIETTSYVPGTTPGTFDAQPKQITNSTKVEFYFDGNVPPNSFNDANNALNKLCMAALNYYMWAKDRG